MTGQTRVRGARSGRAWLAAGAGATLIAAGVPAQAQVEPVPPATPGQQPGRAPAEPGGFPTQSLEPPGMGFPDPAEPAQSEPAAPETVEPEIARLFGDDADSFAGLNVFAGVGLSFGGSLQLAWFDQFTRLTAAGTRESEFRITPTANVRLGYPLGRQSLYLNADLGWDFHTRNPDFDSARVGVGGGLQWRLGPRCAGALDLGYSRRQTQLELFEDRVPSVQDRLGASLSGRCNAPGRLITSFGVNTGRYNYDSSARQFANSRSWGINGGLAAPVGPRGTVGVFASYGKSRYPRQILENGRKVATEFVSVGGNASYRVSPFLTLSGSLGWSEVTSNSPLQPGFDGLTWDILAAYSGPRLGARLSAGRSVSGGDGSFANFAVVNEYLAVLTYRASPRLGFSTGYGRTERDNRVNPLVPPEFVGVDSDTDRLFAGADLSIGRNFRASLDLNYQNRDSSRPNFDYDSFSAILGIGARF